MHDFRTYIFAKATPPHPPQCGLSAIAELLVINTTVFDAYVSHYTVCTLAWNRYVFGCITFPLHYVAFLWYHDNVLSVVT